MGHFNQPPPAPFPGDAKMYLPPINVLGWTRKNTQINFSSKKLWSDSAWEWTFHGEPGSKMAAKIQLGVISFGNGVLWTLTKARNADFRWFTARVFDDGAWKYKLWLILRLSMFFFSFKKLLLLTFDAWNKRRLWPHDATVSWVVFCCSEALNLTLTRASFRTLRTSKSFLTTRCLFVTHSDEPSDLSNRISAPPHHHHHPCGSRTWLSSTSLLQQKADPAGWYRNGFGWRITRRHEWESHGD